MNIEAYIEAIKASGFATLIEGCTEEELQRLESEFNVQFPKDYREIMKTMGKSCGKLIDTREFDFYASQLTKVNRNFRIVIDALREDGEKVPEFPNAFVVMARYDQAYFFVDASGQDTCSVWVWVPDEDRVEICNETIWGLLDAIMKEATWRAGGCKIK